MEERPRNERHGLPVVGVVGAGQLARMMHEAASALGVPLHILASSRDESAALAANDVEVGDHRSLADLRRFASQCDVITWDHEHVPYHHVVALAADGVDVQPKAEALRFAQDKAAMRTRLTELGIRCPRWAELSTVADPKAELASFGNDVGWPVVLKATRGGYDGKGVWMIGSLDDAAEILASGTPLLVEEEVAIARELAADVARTPSGQAAAWPVVETVQRDGVCVEVIAPAPQLARPQAEHAQELALRIATELDVTGVLAVELFETADGQLLVNELAMRPHNSAHWTIEGARTSQFEQHLRAVLDWPLGDTAPAAPVTVMANLLGSAAGPPDTLRERLQHTMDKWPDVKIHLYGKRWRLGRKLGHVTALGHDVEEVRARALAAVHDLAGTETAGASERKAS